MHVCSVLFYGSGLCPRLAVNQLSVVATLFTAVKYVSEITQDLFVILFPPKLLSIEDSEIG